MYFELFITAFIGLFVYLAVSYIIQLVALKKYPPGPFPLPIIGNLHLLSGKPHESLLKLSKTYGEVFSISMGTHRIVVVNNIESAREALIKRGSDVAGRPTNLYTTDLISRGYKDIVFSDYGTRWKSYRKIAHQSLKMYGTGMEKIQSLVDKEINFLEERLDKTEGKITNPHNDIANAVMNIICAMVFGTRYEVNDKEFLEVVRYHKLLTEGFANSDALAFLPWLRFFPNEGLRKLSEAISIRDTILTRKIVQHRETFDENNIRDFTDAILLASHEEKLENKDVGKWFSDDHVFMVVFDIFAAGSETMVTTLLWAFVYLCNWPNVQQRAKEELNIVLGEKKRPDLSQRKQLPYLEAVVHEVLRKSSLTPLGVPHKTVCDIKLNGHPVPVDTQVMFNIWAIHNDARHWKDPENFTPERWLEENGSFESGKNISYLPFSAGRRACLGETLAKTELFMFLSFIIHNYDILPEGPEKYPSLEGSLHITFSPLPYNIIFRKVIRT